LEGLIKRTWKDLEGLGRTWKDLEGLGRTWIDCERQENTDT
jgi:hypothetical protein